MSDKCREDFEKHARALHLIVEYDAVAGLYSKRFVQTLWEGYQAGRADLERENVELKLYIERLTDAAYEDSWCQECGLEHVMKVIRAMED